jgi:hypothetical protein
MGTPGYSAEASIYRSPMHYATVFIPSSHSPHRAIPAKPVRNGGGNGNGCTPECGPCDARCMRTCTNPCTGQTSSLPCCASSFFCDNGQCVCPAPRTVCGGVCTDTATDSNNCGACGNQCAAGQTCQQGSCFPQPMECTCAGSEQTCCQLVAPDERQCQVPRSCWPSCDPSYQPYPWCGQSYPTVVQCDCPAGEVCESICAGGLCSVDWYCQPGN